MGDMTPPAAPSSASAPPTREAPSTRERLLDAAALLFYTVGVHVGVDALCQAAGVSKKSMYQLFGSKDELLAAALRRSIPGFLAKLIPENADSLSGSERIMSLFERVEGLVADPDFQGCAYVSVATGIKAPDHPARQVVLDFHDTLTEYFRAAAEDAGAADPLLLAHQLTMIYDGVGPRAVVHGGPTPGLAVETARTMLKTAGARAHDAADA